MKGILPIFLALSTLLSAFACKTLPVPEDPQEERKEENNDKGDAGNSQNETMPSQIKISVSGKTLPINIENNEATKALVAALREAPITYEADDYGGFEKVGPLGRSLPTSNTQITTQAGDVILYSGNQIVLFYGSNTWSYTRLGKIQYESLEELKSFLKAGEGNISVTLSL
jgi:hypothetical protein